MDQIAKKMIAVADKNASIVGGIAGSTVSTDEIVGVLTGFEAGIGLPANLAVAGASICADGILVLQIQLRLIANLGNLTVHR